MKEISSGHLDAKISIIVPVYGEDEFIDCCISSIVNQTYDNLEIILVDDGSPDNCPRICDEWKLKDNRVVVIHKKNGGLVSARQAGMEAATGRYIGYVDGDDWIEPDTYENMIRVMIDQKVDIVITGFKKDLFGKSIVCLNNIPEGTYDRERLISEVFPTMICNEDNYQYGLYTYVWNKLFKREKIYSHQMNVDKKIVIGEDSACTYPAILASNSIAVTDQTGYHYRQRMNSLLRKTVNGNENIKKLQLFYNYMQKMACDNEFKNMIKKQIYYFYLTHLFMMSDSLVLTYPDLGSGFPFLEVIVGSRIIIYSAGAYGIHVYRQFKESKKFEVLAWVDPDFEQYDGSNYNVVSLDNALKKTFDYIIIASLDKNFVDKTNDLFIKSNIPSFKIISVYQTFDKAVYMLKQKGLIDNGV